MSQPIFCLLIGAAPKYLDLTLRAVKFLKKNVPKAVVGLISPPGSGSLKDAVEDGLKKLEAKTDTSDIIYLEGQNYFSDWNNTQRIFDIQSFAQDYDPIVFLDSDTLILRNLLPLIDDFKDSGKKFGFLKDEVNNYPTFRENWEDKSQFFLPKISFMLFRSSVINDFFPIWQSTWKEWVDPAPFINHKDPARYYKHSALQIVTYSLGQAIFKYVGDFSAEVSVLNRSELKMCRNAGIEPQKTKQQFLSAGSSYSREGQTAVKLAVKSAHLEGDAPQDSYVTVKVGDLERNTKTEKNTLSPTWNEDFVFEDATYADAQDVALTLWQGTGKGAPAETGTAHVSLLHSKTYDAAQPGTPFTLPVLGRDGREVGSVDVVGQFAVQLLPDEDEGAVATRSFGGVKAAAVDGPKSVVIAAVGAKIYGKHDVVGKDDPFLKISIGGVEKTTKVLDNTQTPEWNEKFEWADVTAAQAEFSLWDFDTISKNDLIGTATLALEPYRNSRQSVQLPVYSEEGTEEGVLELQVLLRVDAL